LFDALVFHKVDTIVSRFGPATNAADSAASAANPHFACVILVAIHGDGGV